MQKIKFAMHDAFICKLYIRRYFALILDLRVVKFMKKSKNKVFANNSEFTVPGNVTTEQMESKTPLSKSFQNQYLDVSLSHVKW